MLCKGRCGAVQIKRTASVPASVTLERRERRCVSPPGATFTPAETGESLAGVRIASSQTLSAAEQREPVCQRGTVRNSSTSACSCNEHLLLMSVYERIKIFCCYSVNRILYAVQLLGKTNIGMVLLNCSLIIHEVQIHNYYLCSG